MITATEQASPTNRDSQNFKGDFDYFRLSIPPQLLLSVFMNMSMSPDVPRLSSLNPKDDDFSSLKLGLLAAVSICIVAFVYGEYTGNNWFRKEYQSRDITIENSSTTTKAYVDDQGDITVNTDTSVGAFIPQDQKPIYDFTPSPQTTKLTMPEATYLHRLLTYLKSTSKKICCDNKPKNNNIKEPLLVDSEKGQAFKGDLDWFRLSIPAQLLMPVFMSMSMSLESPSIASLIDSKDDHFSAFKLTCLLTFLGCVIFAGYGECTGSNWLRQKTREINILIKDTEKQPISSKGLLDRDGNVIIKTTTQVQPILDEMQPPQYGFNPNPKTTKPIITKTWFGWFKEKLCGNSENPISNGQQSMVV